MGSEWIVFLYAVTHSILVEIYAFHAIERG
jgi:hypothetical protein